jgi:hypothetical protein
VDTGGDVKKPVEFAKPSCALTQDGKERRSFIVKPEPDFTMNQNKHAGGITPPACLFWFIGYRS